ncbi:MAG: rhomboid family intramembrane serine protease [Vicinamibacteria bacterium]|nr:rhomboid family intramembrane serine protease [Vicinamibacteria bacterium]
MLSLFVVLALLATGLGIRALSRVAGSRARPILQQTGITPGRLSEGLLHALIADRGYLRGDTRIEKVEGSAITIVRDGACGRLVLYPVAGFGREADLQGLKALAARSESSPPSTIVVIGGGAAFGKTAARATAPRRTLLIDDDGRIREVRGGFRTAAPRLVIENALDRVAEELKDGAFSSLDPEIARSLVSSAPEPFAKPDRPFRGVVTSALSLAIVLCFLGEVVISRDALSGEGATLSIVYRMGAIHQPAILAGGWQRLIAAPFLHFGLIHLGMNGWAQWTLGTPIEFLLGSRRFLALWLGSALGASLTSLVFNETSVAAGASGAIFGLLGAFTTFVFFRKDVLPQPVPRSLRNGVLATLLLNLGISFIPSIDMAAHAGGFLTGGLLAFGLARRRPKLESGSAGSTQLRLAVAGLVLLGVGLTSAQDRADLTVKAPEVESEYRIRELVLPIPKDYSVVEARTGEVTTVEADRGPAAPFLVTFKVSDPQADRQAALHILRSLRPSPVPVKDTDWIALSQLGVQNLRAIEIIVVAPASCRPEAEKLVSELARKIR